MHISLMTPESSDASVRGFTPGYNSWEGFPAIFVCDRLGNVRRLCLARQCSIPIHNTSCPTKKNQKTATLSPPPPPPPADWQFGCAAVLVALRRKQKWLYAGVKRKNAPQAKRRASIICWYFAASGFDTVYNPDPITVPKPPATVQMT